MSDQAIEEKDFTLPPPTKQENVMEKEKIFFKTIKLAVNEIQKDKFEAYRIEQEAKKKRNIAGIIIVAIILAILFFILK